MTQKNIQFMQTPLSVNALAEANLIIDFNQFVKKGETHTVAAYIKRENFGLDILYNALNKSAEYGQADTLCLIFDTILKQDTNEKAYEAMTLAFSVACQAGQTDVLKTIQTRYREYTDIQRIYKKEISNILSFSRLYSQSNNLTLAGYNNRLNVVKYLTEGQEDMGLPPFDIHFHKGSIIVYATNNHNIEMIDYLIYERNFKLTKTSRQDLDKFLSETYPDLVQEVIKKHDSFHFFQKVEKALPAKQSVKSVKKKL